MSEIKVAVSPHYRGDKWTDRATGIVFEKQGLNLKVHSINTAEKDLSGIKNSIRLNHLFLLEGEIPADTPDKPSKLNPAELSGEQLDALLENSADDSLGQANESLKQEIKELKAELAEAKEEIAQLKDRHVAEDTAPEKLNRETLDADYTKAQLVALAKEKGIEHKASINKKDLIDLLLESL